MKYEAVLFDMDGVIIDSEPLYWGHMRETLQTIGKDMDEDLFKSQVGTGFRESAPRMTKSLGLDMNAEEFLRFMDATPMYQAVAEGRTDLSLMEGFWGLAEAFAQKYSYAVATGSPPLFLHTVREKFGLDQYFSAFVSADEVAAGKPAPDVYLEAAKRLNVDITRCIVIDDAPAGVAAGSSAGAHVVAAPTQWTRHLDFSPAHMICPSLAEVQAYISSLN